MRRHTSAKEGHDHITNRWFQGLGSSWDVFMPFKVEDTQYFLCYDKETGALRCGKPSHSRSGVHVSWIEISANPSFPPDLTAFVPIPGQPYFIYQQPGTGTTTLVLLGRPKPNTILATGGPIDLPANATLTPVAFDGTPYVLAYDQSTGVLTLYSISLDTHTAVLLDTYNWDTGWKAFTALPDADSVLAYNPDSGTLRAGVLSENGAVPKLTWSNKREFGHDWNRLAPVIHNSGPTFLVYAADSLTAPKIYAIDQFSPVLVLSEKPTKDWPQDVAGIMPFAFNDIDPQEYYLIYQRFASRAQAIGGTLLIISSGSKPGYPEG
jgi:hypothetical protein